MSPFSISNFKIFFKEIYYCIITGATGRISYELANTYPHMKVTVFDLPPVIQIAQKMQNPCSQGQVFFKAGEYDFVLKTSQNIDLALTLLQRVPKLKHQDGTLNVELINCYTELKKSNYHSHSINCS